MKFDWMATCSYDEGQKNSFHRHARQKLKQLAEQLRLEPGTFDLRSNKGGIAVSGEITLHHDRVYVQVSQPAMHSSAGVMFRTCNGRKDYTGGTNSFASFSDLDDVVSLAKKVSRIMQPGSENELPARYDLASRPVDVPGYGRGA